MPQGDQAILNNATAPLFGGGLARWLRSLRSSDSISAMVSRLTQWAASNNKVVRIWGTGAVGVIVVGVVSLILWRAASKPAADFPEPVSSHSTAKAGRGTAVAHPPQSPVAAHSFSNDYPLLVTRSIFAVGGVSSSGRSSGSAAPVAPGSVRNVEPVGYLTLKGILGEDARVSAVVENTNTKQLMEVRTGDPLGPGRVRELTPYDMVFEFDGRTVRIQVGQGLDGTSSVTEMKPVQPGGNSGHKKHSRSGE